MPTISRLKYRGRRRKLLRDCIKMMEKLKRDYDATIGNAEIPRPFDPDSRDAFEFIQIEAQFALEERIQFFIP